MVNVSFLNELKSTFIIKKKSDLCADLVIPLGQTKQAPESQWVCVLEEGGEGNSKMICVFL